MTAPATVDKNLTIRFYELVAGDDQERAAALDWVARTTSIAGQDLDVSIPKGVLTGNASVRSGRLFLQLSKQRETVPRQQNETSKAVADMTTRGAGWHPIEEAFAMFFDWNVFALVRTSQAAPTENSITQWLNAHGPRPHGFWAAQPVVDPEKYRRLADMGGLTMLRVVSAPLSDDDANGSWFRRMFSLAQGGPADLGFTIEIKANRGRKNRAKQTQILETAQRLLAEIRNGTAPQVQQARVTGVPAEGGPLERFSLIQEEVAVEATIPMVGVGGAYTMRPDQVVPVINTAFVQAEASIRSALGVG